MSRRFRGRSGSAFEEAQAAGTTGPILSHLFAAVAHAGKRARTETAISRHTASVSHAAANLAEAELGNLGELRALVVGTGEMAELAIDAMVKRGLTEVACINRTYSSASELARKYQGKAYNWYHLPKALKWADVVITATGAPHAVISADDVAEAMQQRRRGQLLFIDIAVPRDVAETVASVDNVILYDIDHLRSAVDESLAHRRACVPDVEAILADEVEEFLEWLHGRRVAPVIVDMRKRAEILAAAELEQTLSKIGDAVPEAMREPLRLMTRRIVNKVLHEATVNLKSHSCRPNSDQCAMRSYVQMLEHERSEFARTMGWDGHEAIQPRIAIDDGQPATVGAAEPTNGTTSQRG
ncbi:MAG: glutamyl-tRNA reductase [Planctomycetes bacterium]|nr:glutamyl-tRNA reductase [Planctomycetota bacterium]